MLLAIDVGNTNTVLGVFEGTTLRGPLAARATESRRTADEYGICWSASCSSWSGIDGEGDQGGGGLQRGAADAVLLEQMAERYFKARAASSSGPG